MPAKSAIDTLREALKRLPGIGPKSAQRMAFHLLERDRDGATMIVEALNFALASVSHCTHCNNFSETEICTICANTKRDQTLLCVVETPADLESIEQASAFRGVYFVLMGHLAPLDGIGPDQLSVDRLTRTVADRGIREVVLATNLTVEGESTADYIASVLQNSDVVISRLARGVPVGGELEYMDAGTLNQAFDERRQIQR
ncbi:MAG: recombination protein RecR [marine bacterium B5-7]|nr:MAG: recombination protein RecR [marine bacterium B5-7]